MFLPDSVRGTTPGGGLATVLGREVLALPFPLADDLVSGTNVEGEDGVVATFDEEACSLPLIPLLVSDPICCQSSLSALRT